MELITPGAVAPPVPGAAFDDGPTALVFYKVTCPVCQMAAPKFEELERAHPGRVVGVGQDPDPALREFGDDYGMASVRAVTDASPYPVSDAYGIDSVPTVVLVNDGVVAESVPLWDRQAFNRLSERLSALAGSEQVVTSDPSDGLPETRPG